MPPSTLITSLVVTLLRCCYALTSFSMRTMSELSLLTMRWVTLSTRRGAVQRPVNPGEAESYTWRCQAKGAGHVACLNMACLNRCEALVTTPLSSVLSHGAMFIVFLWKKVG
jgi:hypothetical protein